MKQSIKVSMDEVMKIVKNELETLGYEVPGKGEIIWEDEYDTRTPSGIEFKVEVKI